MAENIFPNLENEALVAAMNAIRESETPETQSAFVQEAVKAKYFAPVDVLDENGTPLEGTGKMEIPKNAKFNFKLVTNNKGEQYFPLFTDINEFQKWNKSEQIKAIVVVFPQMASLVSKKADVTNGFVINPMTQNLIFTKELLDNILKHAQQAAAKAQAVQNSEGGEPQKLTYMFGKPVNIPDSVMNSIKKNVAKNPEVNSAYFIMMKQGEQEHYMFVLDIDADEEKCKKIADSLCQTAKLFLTKFPVVVASLKSTLGASAPKVTEPFYTKE
ncbi:MAG: enhanced serine sensitivity protein SseB C-terminal domain-containing protein [Ruminiclostridium sp.]|nr:enhanced serine sensitivity protein SseB C-terminal domain-containing protein [Ruminiclostridium sp.]